MSLHLIDCCNDRQFNSDYPYELTGAINPDEFQQSINNINDARRKTPYEKIVLVGVLLCHIIGIALIVVGTCLIALRSSNIPFIVLVSVGGVAFIGTLCIWICISIFVTRSVVNRMKDAIAAESMRYSTRLPIPTS
jgi:arginine exporter protein ArgO